MHAGLRLPKILDFDVTATDVTMLGDTLVVGMDFCSPEMPLYR